MAAGLTLRQLTGVWSTGAAGTEAGLTLNQLLGLWVTGASVGVAAKAGLTLNQLSGVWVEGAGPEEEVAARVPVRSARGGGSSSWDRYTYEQQRRYDELVAELLEVELELEKAEVKLEAKTTRRLKIVEEPEMLRALKARVKELRAKLRRLKKELKKLYKELIAAEEEEHLIITLMLI